MTWFTSDLHFFHNNVIRFCNRPYASVEEMNAKLIKNWNACVKKNEHVYVLGDFSFRGTTQTSEILKQLNGHKILIRGNHDAPAHKMIAMGFAEVYENHQIRIGDTQLLLSHFPYHPVEYYYKTATTIETRVEENQDKRYLHKRILDDGKSWLLCGHVHQSWHMKDRMINVGVDVNDYKPVSHEKILSIIRGKNEKA